MGRTSFKTHDPFVILELLDGNTSMHLASLLLCSILYFRDMTQGVEVKFKSTISMLIIMHTTSIVCQLINMKIKDVESDIV